jgi:hypothetical protein
MVRLSETPDAQAIVRPPPLLDELVAGIAVTVWRGGLTRLVGATIVLGYFAFLAFFLDGAL